MGTAIRKGIHVGRPPYGLEAIKDIKGSHCHRSLGTGSS